MTSGPLSCEENVLLKDAKYRYYVTSIDKVLKLFDNSSEWADLIPALGKLNKIISNNARYPVIPRSLLISKRLAQCMNHKLPSGVHLKALEIYDVIFKCMGTNRLARDLFLYSTGLFPLLANSALTVRPVLLTIYETHFVPLGPRLRPALSGFLIGILPGLDINSEYSDRTNNIVRMISDGVGYPYFYSCLWNCIVANSSIRLSGFTYLLNNFNKQIPIMDQQYVLGSDLDVFVNGLSSGIQDANILVQRAALDFLLAAIPVKNVCLSDEHVVELIKASVTILLRRDVSLTRRLYSWLFDSDKLIEDLDTDPNDEILREETQQMLLEAIRSLLRESSQFRETNAFKLLAMIFDKIEIQNILLNRIGLDVFRLAYRVNRNIQTNTTSSSDEKQDQYVELKKNLSYFCNSLETNFVWSFLQFEFESFLKNKQSKNPESELDLREQNDIGSQSTNILELCILIEFLIDIVPSDVYTFNTSDILPNLFINLIHSMRKFVDKLMSIEIITVLELLLKIIRKIQPIVIQKPKDLQVDDVKANFTLEKSKSDSKLSENVLRSNDHVDENFQKTAKKYSQAKKSKSSSRIDDLSKIQEPDRVSDDEISTIIENEILTKHIHENRDLAESPIPETTSENEPILKCFEVYKKFFIDFNLKKVFPKSVNIEEYFSVFLRPKLRQCYKSTSADLETILKYYIETNDKSNPYLKSGDVELSTEFGPNTQNLRLDFNDEQCDVYDRAMISVLNLLFEFNSYSNLIHFDVNETIVYLPKWLKVLIIIACYENSKCERQHDTQICAINILLKIIGLVKEQNVDQCSAMRRKPIASTNLIVMGILRTDHVHFIEKSTFVIEILSQILWRFLDVSHAQKHVVTCVNLLYFINNVFGNENFAENVINKFLLQESLNVESFKKFAILWHLGKSIDSILTIRTKPIKHFDRCLLRILDNLEQNYEKSNLKVFTEELLVQSVLRNDIVRIIYPILSILLSSATARVSINHFNLEKSQSKTDSLNENANSNVNANANANANVNVNDNDIKVNYKAMEKSKLNDNSVQLPKYNKLKNLLFGRSPKKERKVLNLSNTTPPTSTSTSMSTPSLHVTSTTQQNETTNNDEVTDSTTLTIATTTTATPTTTTTDIHGISSSVTSPISNFNFREVYSDGVAGQYTKLEGTPASPVKSKPEDGDHFDIFADKLENVQEKLNDERALIDTDSINEDGGDVETAGAGDISDTSQLSDCEASTTAEDFFTTNIPENHTDLKVNNEENKDMSESVDTISVQTTSNWINVYSMHSHILLYCDIFDTPLIMYALRTLKNCILVDQKLFTRSLATIKLQNSINNSEIFCNLARHQKAKNGLGYFGDLDFENVIPFKGAMFLEVVIIVCLNYASSFFAYVDNPKLTDEIKENNLKIQFLSLEILEIIVKSLINLVHENNDSFARYVASLLAKSDMQRTILQILLVSVRDFDQEMTLAEEVLKFNGFYLFDDNSKITEQVEAAQILLLRLVQSLIILEYEVFVNDDNESKPVSRNATSLISEQPMFLSAILSALRQSKIQNLHQNWCNMVTTSLPYYSKNLKQIAISTIQQICVNIDNNTKEFLKDNRGYRTSLIPNYLTNQLDSLTSICHFCLLDTQQYFSRKHSVSPSVVTTQSTIMNILSAFVPSTLSAPSTELSNNSNQLTAVPNRKNYPKFYILTRKALLNQICRVITSLLDLWRICYQQTESLTSSDDDFYSVFGNENIIKQQILDLLNPLVIHHSSYFLLAVAMAWYEKRPLLLSNQKNLVKTNEYQESLIQLLLTIKVLPLDSLLNICLNMVRCPIKSLTFPNDFSLNVTLFEVVFCYINRCSKGLLIECWSSLLCLLRESYSLSYHVQLIAFLIINDVVLKCCPLTDKKDQKDIQDVTSKMIECLSQICGSSLEQTTWLRKNLSVREQDKDNISLVPNTSSSLDQTIMNFSVEAEKILGNNLATMIDICFGSQEKEKVNYILSQLMVNIIPYLKYHSSKNLASFNACSKLAANLSNYQYTRKVWKKDFFDLLMDWNFFQMNSDSLYYWKIIVDNLMTQDTTFRDLMGRVSLSQNVGLNLFSSKDQEYEQRVQMLKRLSFVIYCSETDQYSKYMPEIQEQLKISLKLCVPNVLVQVFYCYRILLLKMSSSQVTHLWPFIISEMLQVFLLIEKELECGSDDNNFRIKVMSGLDPNWSINLNSSLQSTDKFHWLSLQLATAKLLDITLLLPATSLPQFQLYRWAFVSESNFEEIQTTEMFVPYLKRISDLMDLKYGCLQVPNMNTGQLLIHQCQMDSLRGLHKFAKQLSQVQKTQYFVHFKHIQDEIQFFKEIDDVIGTDFLEPLK